MIYTLSELFRIAESTSTHINGKWVPCRGINHTLRSFQERIKEAYLVFSGKADCFIWPEGQ